MVGVDTWSLRASYTPVVAFYSSSGHWNSRTLYALYRLPQSVTVHCVMLSKENISVFDNFHSLWLDALSFVFLEIGLFCDSHYVRPYTNLLQEGILSTGHHHWTVSWSLITETNVQRQFNRNATVWALFWIGLFFGGGNVNYFLHLASILWKTHEKKKYSSCLVYHGSDLDSCLYYSLHTHINLL